jgi:outer membrane protein assembly factor BamA
VIGGVGLEYHIPYVLLDNSAFNNFMPNGSKGGFMGFFKAGLIWENRDSEFDPGKGNRIAIEFFGAPSLTSAYSMTAYRIDLRQYARFFNTITLAVRLEGQHAISDVPYWRLPTLGDDYTLRGYPLNRFKGASSIASNLELRTWVFRIPSYNIKLGGQLFTDLGRVFTEEDDWGDLFNNYKQTYGFGGAMSLFSPDFILRGDIGFSEEVSRIYIGIGYTF